MGIFAKLVKPVFYMLRKLGVVSILYVDDTLFLYEDTFACQSNLGFVVEIAQWIENISTAFGKIKTTPGVDYVIHIDASNKGWGASEGRCPDVNGRWTLGKQMLNIDDLKLKAVKLALHSYLPLNPGAKH